MADAAHPSVHKELRELATFRGPVDAVYRGAPAKVVLDNGAGEWVQERGSGLRQVGGGGHWCGAGGELSVCVWGEGWGGWGVLLAGQAAVRCRCEGGCACRRNLDGEVQARRLSLAAWLPSPTRPLLPCLLF